MVDMLINENIDLENEIKENLGLTGTGQDVSFFRSVVKNKGVYIIFGGCEAVRIKCAQ